MADNEDVIDSHLSSIHKSSKLFSPLHSPLMLLSLPILASDSSGRSTETFPVANKRGLCPLIECTSKFSRFCISTNCSVSLAT
jgi:hypothetical protein